MRYVKRIIGEEERVRILREELDMGHRKRVDLLIATIMMSVFLMTVTGCSTTESLVKDMDTPLTPVALHVCTAGNPITHTTGGDPSALVDNGKVYLYTGHDVSTDEEVKKAIYNIPEYLCYSSDDMVNWREEGVVMSMDSVPWTADDTSAWASQVVKHDGNYYLYFCSWDKSGKQSIGVAVSDAPTGPFKDIGEPLVRGALTKPDLSSFNDIDPTVWIEMDKAGEEHRYLAWGNGVFFVCELNRDMVSVRDRNGDGQITCGLEYTDDILKRTAGLEHYTEAPWMYRRMDENGEFFGDYYLFFAHEWRESIAYATIDDLFSGTWSATKRIMYPTATSNTNHPAVIDFKGKTYFIGHNGALPGGSGFRRSITIQELVFGNDGSINLMEETASGVSGESVTISVPEGKLMHRHFLNSAADADYPYQSIPVGVGFGENDSDAYWVLRSGKADPENIYTLSVEAENKPGLFLTVRDDEACLLQDTDGTEEIAKQQTFYAYRYGDNGVLLACVMSDDMYLVVRDGALVLGNRAEAERMPFIIE